MTKRFSIWENHSEQWDANDINPPDAQIDAMSAAWAAERYADLRGSFDDSVYLIVRDNKTEEYFEIEVVKKWECDLYKPTTLEELCKP